MAKTTTRCAPFVKLVEWKFESEASEFAEWNYNQVEFKERLSNEGDITLVRKFEKRSSSSHGEEPNNCALALVIMLRKTFIAMWHRRCAKIFLEKTAFRIPLLWKPWHFELYAWSSLLARFRVRDRNYLSVRFIFELQNLRGHPDGFSWLVNNRAYFGSAQNTQLLDVFSARTEFLALAVGWFSRPRRPKKRPR